MGRAKAFYFTFFGGLACLAPFLTLYYQELQLSGPQIGVLTGLVPLVGLAGSTIWGMIADATGRHRLLFLLAIVSTWLSVLLMSRASSFAQLVPIVVLYAFAYSPIIPLVDDAVIHWLGPQQRGDYGRQRVWGSYGWGLVGALIGVIITAYGLRASFVGFLAAFALLLLVGIGLPMNPSGIGARFWGEVRALLSERAWTIFLAVALVEGMSFGVILNYLFLYLDSIGTSATIMGLTLTMATLSEIPIFLGSRRLLNRWSPPLLLAFSLLFTVVRAFGYVAMTEPWQVLLISLLHGPTFALMWIAGVAYAATIAPPGLGATAQGLFGGVSMGLGVAIGALAGGLLYDALGPLSVFTFAGVAALLATTVFVWINRGAFRRQLQPAYRE